MIDRLKGINIENLKDLAERRTPMKYSQLCDAIGIQKLTSDSKKAQLDDLAAICDYEIIPNPTRLLITKCYDGSLEIVQRNRGKYTPLIEAILCSALKHNEKIYLTTKQLVEVTKMANVNYFMALRRNEQKKICSRFGYNELEFKEFIYKSYDNVFRPIVRDALRSMEKRSVIIINQAFKYKNEDGFPVVVSADTDLGRKFLDIENRVKAELGYADKQYTMSFDWDRYNQICRAYAMKELGIDGFYRCKEIISKKEIAVRRLNELQSALNVNVRKRIEGCLMLPDISHFCDDMIDIEPKNMY